MRLAGSPKVLCERVKYAGMSMPVPLKPLRKNLRLAGLACAVVAVCCGVLLRAVAEKQPAPAMKLSLESLGVPGYSTAFLETGSSLLTLHFLDSQHLLLTFGERKLVPRLVDDPSDDDDRLVAGEVVELPSGKILAKTEWHMHDHSRYLWSLGHGRFLLRIGNSLYTMAPLANLSDEEPFKRVVFAARGVRPSLVYTSEDGGLLTVESELVASKNATEINVSDRISVKQQKVTVLDFYRLSGAGSEASPLEVKLAGTLRSPELFHLPLDSDGYLWAEEVANNHWAVTFDDMRGKTGSMGTIDSTCLPRLELLTPSEFLAMTCRGGDDRIRMGSYGFDGQNTWQEDLGDFGAPSFAYAPGASRFAVSHRTSAPTQNPGNVMNQGPQQPPPSDGQEIRVYQNASGDMLLKLQPTPAFKTAENFDLSEDGTAIAMVKDGAVTIYKLPVLTKRDKDDMAEVAKFAPPPGSGPVAFQLLTGSARASRRTAAKLDKSAAAQVDAGTETAVNSTEPAQTSEEGKPATAGPRKPPTLLNPGEKPEFGKANEQGEETGTRD
jgi:hypothetical protein